MLCGGRGRCRGDAGARPPGGGGDWPRARARCGGVRACAVTRGAGGDGERGGDGTSGAAREVSRAGGSAREGRREGPGP